jgi:hypothetical protein
LIGTGLDLSASEKNQGVFFRVKQPNLPESVGFGARAGKQSPTEGLREEFRLLNLTAFCLPVASPDPKDVPGQAAE